ncbi:sporulation protein YpjB [Paenibacillus abyssi]|uniref:Sporulation protein YpjB n=1 Tax=Paenibacillus abyssi TaxID=1340531 RepID=A0A917CHD3_9BACL|nr:sporulation protein YpjB [Paenibacillus abyssi]GGF88965.1 hypothetical protein GCM10010916_02850 [Paenibacillus abyssi]
MRGKLTITIMLASLLLVLCPVNSGAAARTVAVPVSVDSALQQHAVRLAAISDELYQAASDGNKQLTYYNLSRLRRLTADPSVRQLGSKQGWTAAEETIRQLSDALQYGKLNGDARADGAKLMLAFDALSSGERALWISYHEIMQDDLNRLIKAWQRQTDDRTEAAVAALKTLSGHIELIVPAALMQRDPMLVQALQETYQYTLSLLNAGQSGRLERLWMDNSLAALSQAVDLVFYDSEGETIEPVLSPIYGGMPWRWTIVIGLLIISVLMYVGWQKYRFERDRVVKQDRANLP